MLFKSFNIVICSIFFLSACNQLPKDNSKLSLKYLGAAEKSANDFFFRTSINYDIK